MPQFTVLKGGKKKEHEMDVGKEGGRGGSLIGTVELQHPLLPLDVIDNI
jgi:hypothetical protein